MPKRPNFSLLLRTFAFSFVLCLLCKSPAVCQFEPRENFFLLFFHQKCDESSLKLKSLKVPLSRAFQFVCESPTKFESSSGNTFVLYSHISSSAIRARVTPSIFNCKINKWAEWKWEEKKRKSNPTSHALELYLSFEYIFHSIILPYTILPIFE